MDPTTYTVAVVSADPGAQLTLPPIPPPPPPVQPVLADSDPVIGITPLQAGVNANQIIDLGARLTWTTGGQLNVRDPNTAYFRAVGGKILYFSPSANNWISN